VTEAQATERPLGVTVLATLNLLSVLPLLLFGLAVFLDAVLTVREEIAEASADALPIVTSSFAGVIGLGLAALGAAGIIVGIGLLRMRPWARVIALGVAVLLLSFFATLLTFSLFRFDPLRWAVELSVVGYNGWIVWYLLRPETKKAFAS
jgi:hypothetical protein